MPESPKPPPPRTDVPPPKNVSAQDWADYLEDLASAGPPPAWIATDGTLYMRYLPAQMAPPVGGPVDSGVAIPPSSPMYATYVRTVESPFNYQGVEVPDAQPTTSSS